MKIQKTLFTGNKYAHRKTARPVSTREYNHIIYKSRTPILRKNSRLIKLTIADAQERFGFKIKSLAIMPDHIHFLIQVRSRKVFADSMRFLAGQIAQKITRGKFWKQRLWSRVVRRGRDFETALNYVSRNAAKAGLFSMQDTFVLWNGILSDAGAMYRQYLEMHSMNKDDLQLRLRL